MQLLDLDVGRGQREQRTLQRAGLLTHVLMPYDEKVLQMCLLRLIEHDEISAAGLVIREAARGALLPDLHLLAGAFHLAEGRLADAAGQLVRCYQSDPEPGLAIRRMLPSLRFLVRLAPCVLVPLYPNAYGAALIYAVTLSRTGQSGEALEVVRDMVSRWGLFDELKLLAGLIHLQRGHIDRAVKALTVSEQTERDALELSRALYLAYAHFQLEEYRSAARALGSVMHVVRDANPHLHARARLLLSELYERNGLLLNALRESGRVEPNEVPADVTAIMLEREERWITELGLLSNAELERMAHADTYLMYVPDAVQPRPAYSPLDTSRNIAKQLKPRAMSWIKRRQEQRTIDAYREALARGESVEPPGAAGLSPAGAELKSRIGAAERWWVSRRQALVDARPSDKLARQDPLAVGHLRFDFCGARTAPPEKLVGEKRAQMLTALLGASLLIFVCLWLLQTCVY